MRFRGIAAAYGAWSHGALSQRSHEGTHECQRENVTEAVQVPSQYERHIETDTPHVPDDHPWVDVSD